VTAGWRGCADPRVGEARGKRQGLFAITQRFRARRFTCQSLVMLCGKKHEVPRILACELIDLSLSDYKTQCHRTQKAEPYSLVECPFLRNA